MLLRIEKLNFSRLRGHFVSNPVFSTEETSGLWRNFRALMAEKGIKSDFYSVQIHEQNAPGKIIERWAAVKEGEGLPSGLQSLEIPAGLYAVFLYKGGAGGFVEFYQDQCSRAIPDLGLMLDERPHFQLLGDKFNPFSDDSEEEIWIPVKPGLDPDAYRLCNIAAISSLLSLGHNMGKLRTRLQLALETGFSLSDLKEIIIQVSLYAGFPRSLNGMACLREVIGERQNQGLPINPGKNPSPQPAYKSRYELGWETLQSLDDEFILKLKAGLDPVSPELFTLVLEHGYADIFYRDNLDIRQREAAVVAAMVAVENADPQLSFHMLASLKTGIHRDVLVRMISIAAKEAGKSPKHALHLLEQINP